MSDLPRVVPRVVSLKPLTQHKKRDQEGLCGNVNAINSSCYSLNISPIRHQERHHDELFWWPSPDRQAPRCLFEAPPSGLFNRSPSFQPETTLPSGITLHELKTAPTTSAHQRDLLLLLLLAASTTTNTPCCGCCAARRNFSLDSKRLELYGEICSPKRLPDIGILQPTVIHRRPVREGLRGASN